jgi:hypothetical protein
MPRKKPPTGMIKLYWDVTVDKCHGCINGIGITDWDYEGEVVAGRRKFYNTYIYILVESVVAEVLAALYVVDFGREINFLGIIFAL